MVKSIVAADNWFDSPPPLELMGATVAFILMGGDVQAVVTHIGSSVFHATPTAMRQYDMESTTRIWPYISTIIARLVAGGATVRYMIVTDVINGGIARAYDPAHTTPRSPGFKPIWANAPWGSTKVIDPSKDMVSQMGNSADDLIGLLGANAAPGEPPLPAQRVEEENPAADPRAPHRRTVLKGTRDAATYIKSLLK